jgi:hypothetical protein
MDFVWDKIQVVNGQPSEPILIIARDFRYAREWCRVHNINMYSPMIRLATRLSSLQGISGMYYVDLGTDNADFRTLIERLKSMAAIKPLLTPNC